MEKTWKRIHAWLDANAPSGYGNLRPGADADTIGAAEKEMGLKLPCDVTDSYRIHDGQESEPGLVGGEGWMLLPLQEVVRNQQRCSQACPEGAHRLPIASIGTGDYVFLDLDPNAGEPGRLKVQRADSPTPTPLAASFSAWLEEFAGELEEGEFAYSEADGELLLADEVDLGE